jgi:hydroxymethylpyrimidine/phosphomethylpyrimidine kinase
MKIKRILRPLNLIRIMPAQEDGVDANTCKLLNAVLLRGPRFLFILKLFELWASNFKFRKETFTLSSATGEFLTKKVLTIAGSDCSGGAGIQADLKTFSAHGVFGMSVIVSVVAENTSRVIDIQDVSPDMIEKQIDAIFEDIDVDAVKVGMLSNAVCMRAVAGRLRQYAPKNVVVDPVMYAKNGCPLMAPEAIDTLIDVIIPLADVLTPNIPEAEKIAGMKINEESDGEGGDPHTDEVKRMERAAERICRMGCKTVLVKGGHSAGSALDVLFDGQRFVHFDAPRVDTKNTHGTGCTYSSAIASNLALGMEIPQAIERAKAYVTTAIQHALPIGGGNGPTHHFYDLYRHGLK